MPFNLTTFTKSLNTAFKQLKKTQSDALSIEIAANFTAGMTAAEKHTSIKSAEPEDPEEDGLTTEEKAVIALLTAQYLGSLTKFNKAAKAQILSKVKELVQAGSDHDEIKKYVDVVLSGKDIITIDNVGKIRKEIYVDKDLKISEVEKVITRKFGASIDTYSELLGEQASHASYEAGRKAQYQRQGFENWVFVGPADEKARPAHVALIGCVFEWGTDQSEYAEQVLKEPHCRHRAQVYYNDETKDTKKEVWDKLKNDAGLYWDKSKNEWSLP